MDTMHALSNVHVVLLLLQCERKGLYNCTCTSIRTFRVKITCVCVSSFCTHMYLCVSTWLHKVSLCE